MNDLAKAVERYLAAWNETDPAARHAIIQETWAADGRYVDPLVEAAGLDEIEATIGAVAAEFPDFVFTLAGPVDAHHNVARFTWNLGPAGAEAVVVGFDVLAVDGEGLIRTVHGFLDKVPAGL